MRRVLIVAVCSLAGILGRAASASEEQLSAVPFEFDPFGTHLVGALWKGGFGCPTNAKTTPDGETFLPYTDPACDTGDPRDKRVEGLLMAKTGPTANYASSGAVIKGVKGMKLTELGYDIRKPLSSFDDRGSHCGAGAPRFNVTTRSGKTYSIGCNSPAANEQQPGNGWVRLRWGGAFPLMAFDASSTLRDISGVEVKQLSIVFDEGQDTGPDNFGAAVLDNIDVNGTLIGRGPKRVEEEDEDDCEGENEDHDRFKYRGSKSRPERSKFSYQDRKDGVSVQSIGGARSITHSGACVTLLSDAVVNEEPGYLVTFVACDLSAVPLAPSLGTMSITVTGPDGYLYEKSKALISGSIKIDPH
jgi:hypothetical protein